MITNSWGGNRDPLNTGKTGCTMNWPDYQAVTGEQVWAALIGPLQTMYNVFDGKINKNYSK